jgi:hypothetical protein
MTAQLSGKCSSVACEIASFIKERLISFQGFGARSFYGEAFSLALLAETSLLDETTKGILASSFDSLDKGGSEFHWEFNNYALLHYKKCSHDGGFDDILALQRFKGTPCTNWTLLRSNAKLSFDGNDISAIDDAKRVIKLRQQKNGLILDDLRVKSFQYHCFSLAMVVEIFEKTKDEFFLKAFLLGIRFIRNFILSNGDTLYVGRGQEQSFGYGALVYVLAQAFSFTKDTTILEEIERVMAFLCRFQRDDGSFPLVMREGEDTIPEKVDVNDPQYLGWYNYNNYFDYLPFMGFFLVKASCVLSQKPQGKELSPKPPSPQYHDDEFIRISQKEYDAVIGKPGGRWTNDLAFPYIVYKGRALTPCYGGEQEGSKLYSVNDSTLPYFPKLGKSLRQKAFSFLQGNTLVVTSPCGMMVRRFSFLEKEIHIKSFLLSPFSREHQFCFFEDIQQKGPCHLIGDGFEVATNNPLAYKRDSYCALGRLKVFTATSFSLNVTMRLV